MDNFLTVSPELGTRFFWAFALPGTEYFALALLRSFLGLK
jgi:hypothetical protein